MNSTMCSHGTDDQNNSIRLPDFVKPVTATQAAVRRWKHNVVSWSAVPLRSTLWRSQSETDAQYSQCAVLMYHRVCETPKQRFAPTYSVTPKRFRQQLAWLVNHGYTPLRLSELATAVARGAELPRKSFVVTFDDGYENNATQALPILAELGIPATVFVATAFIGSAEAFPFDDWMVGVREELPPDAWRPASESHYHQMLASGLIELGAHTHRHADFRGEPELLRDDLEQCLRVLEQRFGIRRPAFAFPFGEPAAGFADQALADVVREMGCYCAVQTGNQSLTSDVDAFHLPRFDVAAGDTGPSLATKIDGQLETLRSCFRSLKGAGR